MIHPRWTDDDYWTNTIPHLIALEAAAKERERERKAAHR